MCRVYMNLLVCVRVCRFIVLAVVLSYLIIILMRWIAGPIIFICILLFICSFAFGNHPSLCHNTDVVIAFALLAGVLFTPSFVFVCLFFSMFEIVRFSVSRIAQKVMSRFSYNLESIQIVTVNRRMVTFFRKLG